MQRNTLIDFFRDLSASRDEFLAYDDGYRRKSYTYQQVGVSRAWICGQTDGGRTAEGR